MRWIADTNVISETSRKSPNAAVSKWIEETPNALVFTTVVTIAEIRFGIALQKDAARANELKQWLESFVRPLFEDRVFGVDEDVILTWRTFSSDAQRRRKPAPPVDLLIAAIASVNTCAVVTRDAGPFAAAGVPVFNPWTDERFHFG